MVVGEANINDIMGGIENTGIRHNHKRKLKQRFDIIKKLGQGTYGKVQLGINKETGQEVAIKTIKKSKIESEADLIRIRREIQIMSSVQHPNIIHIYEVFENREKMVLVMEYAAGGELYDYLSERKVLSEDEARRIFRQIATACYYCHKHKICHRDLKLENILLDENSNAKIADFGLSNVFDDQRLLNTFCGSPLYASPEIVRGTPYHGPEVDCWSLGVLLYTLVYGAMPFDGSNFKRLVKQISQGDYFEPQKPSPASPLIKAMLTVNPRNRADIEKICAHWWVNEGYDESCLEVSEHLANQTPVRLDLLLSLAPPPPQLESEKLVVTGEVAEDAVKAEAIIPTRSQSVGSLMELAHPAEKRIKDLINDERIGPKRKLESTVSTDRANLASEGLKRKDKIIKENTVADITLRGTIQEDASVEDASMAEATPLEKSSTRTISREMDVEQPQEVQGAACAEIIEDAAKKDEKKTVKAKKEVPQDKENTEAVKAEKVQEKEEPAKSPTKKKVVKKKVLTDKNDNARKEEAPAAKPKEKVMEEKPTENQQEVKDAEAPSKPVERRRSKIFETAEKFQNLIAASDSKSVVGEKSPKIVIPGVSVGGYKKEFERKASLTSTSPPKVKAAPVKKTIIDQKPDKEPEKEVPPAKKANEKLVENSAPPAEEKPSQIEKEKVKNAVNIISSALDKEGTRKSKSRPCMYRKPPVPFGSSGRSASGSIGMIPTPFSPTEAKQSFKLQIGPNEMRTATVEVSSPEHTRFITEPLKQHEESKTSSAEITLKSATLPRRKTTKAEIRLDYPTPKPATMEFKTEMAHRVEAAPKPATQRSEVSFPVSAPPTVEFRPAPFEAEAQAKASPKERIIPIAFEKGGEGKKEQPVTPPAKPTTPKIVQGPKPSQSQRSNSLSRQSTQESDSETASTGEPIRKSPREFIIPIAVEGGGYVTPRAGSLEPSDTASTLTNRSLKFRTARRMNSLLSDRDGSEDESPFTNLHRHSSFGRDSDNEDSRKDSFHMHRLRSSRPRKANLEHNDSLSSGEDDDDDGFEIVTAENLFSTLLSRVRDLTQRLNVEDGGRPGFPSSRLLSHFDHGTNFWNLHNRLDPLSRNSPIARAISRDRTPGKTTVSGSFTTPWRRSVSRDLASDIESVFKEGGGETHTATIPRGDDSTIDENLNLADLDLKKLKLTDEDALALSYLTPGLSKRIQKQLLAQLAPSEARKLSRTLSMRDSSDSTDSGANRFSYTLPRRFSTENSYRNSIPLPKINEPTPKSTKSLLPVKFNARDPYSSSIYDSDAETKSENYLSSDYRRARPSRSASLREPKVNYRRSFCPDSSYSEDSSALNDNCSKRYSDVSPVRYSSYSPETSTLSKYLAPIKNYDSSRSYIPNVDTEKKTELRKPSSKRPSRFLRPDFYDSPKEENVYLKEKKEREMETQKVLKEIRDKRIKNRLSMQRERSASKERQVKDDSLNNNSQVDEANAILKNVSDNIKVLESTVHDYVNVKNEEVPPAIHDYVNVMDGDKNGTDIHDYVNVKATEAAPVVKKERTSKLVRPKSYPTDSTIAKKPDLEVVPEKETKSKIGRLKKGFITQKKDDNENGNKSNGENPSKNKFLQTLEKKITKLRSMNNGDNQEKPVSNDKKSSVENAIRRLREQSLPRNLDHITESGLIKRAVSVEDMTCDGNPKALQASRKSVSKILGLFKKYEERDKKKTEKIEKSKKSKESINDSNSITDNEASCSEKKPERPKSLLLDRVKQFQNDNKPDNSLVNGNETKPKLSRLPVNSFRRSLNLDNSKQMENVINNNEPKPDRKTLKLDLSKTVDEKIPNNLEQNRNSLAVTDTSSPSFLSPCDDNELSCDSWSVSSDHHHHNDLTSPVSPNGYLYSGDEGESVIDRIRRKSFYSRFNEKKKQPRKTSFRDLDLYKDINNSRKTGYSDYDSLNRRYRKSDAGLDGGRKSYSARSSEPRYQTYNPKRAGSIYSDSEDAGNLDGCGSTGKPIRYSTLIPSSTFNRSSISPLNNEQYNSSLSPTIQNSYSPSQSPI